MMWARAVLFFIVRVIAESRIEPALLASHEQYRGHAASEILNSKNEMKEGRALLKAGKEASVKNISYFRHTVQEAVKALNEAEDDYKNMQSLTDLEEVAKDFARNQEGNKEMMKIGAHKANEGKFEARDAAIQSPVELAAAFEKAEARADDADARADDAVAKLTESQGEVKSLKAMLKQKAKETGMHKKAHLLLRDQQKRSETSNANKVRQPLPEAEQVSRPTRWKKLYPKAFTHGEFADQFSDKPWIATPHTPQKSKAGEKIVNGQPVTANEFPFVVTDPTFNCGASLIHPRFVLTAAHCAYPDAQKMLHIGRIAKNETLGLGPQLALFVEKVHYHHLYDGKLYADVALYELREPVPADRYAPVWLSDGFTGKFERRHLTQTVVGWGKTSADASGKSDILLKTQVLMESNTRCNAEDMVTKDMLDNTQLCAGDISAGADGSKNDACVGDSGGPLFATDNDGNFIQSGIVSFGIGCGNARSPGVYARVSWAYPWIASVIGKKDGGLQMGPDTRPNKDPKKAVACQGADRQIYVTGMQSPSPTSLRVRKGEKIAFFNVGGWNAVRVWNGTQKEFTSLKSYADFGEQICMGTWYPPDTGSFKVENVHLLEHRESVDKPKKSTIEVESACAADAVRFKMELTDKRRNGLSGGTYTVQVLPAGRSADYEVDQIFEAFGGNFGAYAKHEFCVPSEAWTSVSETGERAAGCLIVKFNHVLTEEGRKSAQETSWTMKYTTQSGDEPEWTTVLGSGTESSDTKMLIDGQTSTYSFPLECNGIAVCGDGTCSPGENCRADCGIPDCEGDFVKDCRSGVSTCHSKKDIKDGVCDNSFEKLTGSNLCCYQDEADNDCSPAECTAPTCIPSNGQVKDCADEDCTDLSYVGDGVCDGLKQPFGSNLCCYEGNYPGSYDGGDCSKFDCETFIPHCPSDSHIGKGLYTNEDPNFCYCDEGYEPDGGYTRCDKIRVPCPGIEGDADKDGTLDVNDLVAMVEKIQDGWVESDLICLDLDEDDAITVLDIVKVTNDILETAAAEYAASAAGLREAAQAAIDAAARDAAAAAAAATTTTTTSVASTTQSQ